MELYDKIADLALLWRRTAEIFSRFEEVKCDWDQAFYDFLPRLAGTDDAQTHLLFAEFMNLLGDGHTDYQFPRAFLKEIGFLPFSLRYCGNAYFVDGTLPGQEDRLGAVVEKIDGRPFSDVLDEAARYGYRVGKFLPESRLNGLLPLLLPGKVHTLETSEGIFPFRLLPEKIELHSVGKRRKFEIRDLENDILYVNLPDFMHGNFAATVRAALEKKMPSGLILDIRENIGGMTLLGAQVAELLIPGEFSGCRKRTRIGRGVDLASASQIILESPEEQAREIAAGLYTQEDVEASRRQMAGTYTESYQDGFRSGGFPGDAAQQSPGNGDRNADLRHYGNANAPASALRRRCPHLFRGLPAAGRNGISRMRHPAGYSHGTDTGGYPCRQRPGAGEGNRLHAEINCAFSNRTMQPYFETALQNREAAL